MDLTTVHLVRHGEVHNPEGVLYGRLPGYHLSALGNAMAERLAEVFSQGHDIRAVITSPLERAIETGTPTAAAFQLPLQQDINLLEAGNQFEGEFINKRGVLAHPRFWKRYINPARPSWGEPYAEIAQRMARAVKNGLEQGRGGEVVLVSHQLPIWVFRLFIAGKPYLHDPRKRECALASVTSLSFVDNQLVSWKYWEPAAELLQHAQDMTPGTSAAAKKTTENKK